MKEHQARKISRAALDVSVEAARRGKGSNSAIPGRARAPLALCWKRLGFQTYPGSFSSPARAFKKKKKKNHTRASGGKRVLNRSAFSKRGPKSLSFEANFFFFFLRKHKIEGGNAK